MRWLAAMVVVLGGCDWFFQLHGFSHDAAIDVLPPDSETFFDAPPPGTVCMGKEYGVHLCFFEATLVPLTIGSRVIDTDNDVNCQRMTLTNGRIACVYAATTVTITNDLVATGSHPLVIVARDDVSISGIVDVSSTITSNGAGANDGGCVPTEHVSMQAPSGLTAGGGPGGSFAGKGGNGGPAESVAVASASTQTSGTTLRGGCPGGNGGLDLFSQGAGLGGASGGAVYIASNHAITVTATGAIYATGAPSTGTGTNAGGYPGGGGGGSGGMIVLDGMTITLMSGSLLIAAGASGGSGGDGTIAGEGGSVPTGPDRAPGGAVPAMSSAGVGGASSGAGDLDGVDGRPLSPGMGGAGGGGGGAGFIKLFSPSVQSSGTVVPPAS